MPDLTIAEWAWAAAAAVGVGISKAGFPGMSLAHVIIFAMLFGARESTGVVLPMLIAGDLGAIGVFYPHTQWDHLRRMLPPACVGVVLGAVLMGQVSDASFAPILGWIILILTVWTARGTEPFSTGPGQKGTQLAPSSVPFWANSVEKGSVPLGLLAGMTTMLANAGGPVMTLYLVAMRLPKFQFTATVAWFFFAINLFKVPFSVGLGLITWSSLGLNAMLLPGILLGLVAGRWLIQRVPQKLFNQLLLAFAGLASLRLIGVL